MHPIIPTNIAVWMYKQKDLQYGPNGKSTFLKRYAPILATLKIYLHK